MSDENHNGIWNRNEEVAQQAQRIAELEAECEHLTAQIEAVRDIHQNKPTGFCYGCDYGYPCPTIRALDATNQALRTEQGEGE